MFRLVLIAHLSSGYQFQPEVADVIIIIIIIIIIIQVQHPSGGKMGGGPSQPSFLANYAGL
jgi:hypothetical protein